MRSAILGLPFFLCGVLCSSAVADAATHVSAPPVSASVLISGSGYFGGFTSQDGPAVVRLTRSATRVRRAVAALGFSCTSGERFVEPDDWRNVPIRRRRFSATDSDTFMQSGLTFQGTSAVTGRLNRRRTRITGTWQTTVVARNPAGAVVDTCATGAVTYTVRR